MVYNKRMNTCSYVCKGEDEMKCKNNDEHCKHQKIHGKIVDEVNRKMPDEEKLYDLAELFKVFGDSTRIKILYVLFESSMSVCCIADVLGMTQSAISHQLRILKQNKLVAFKREGKSIIYSLADDHVHNILGQGMDHINE